MAEAKETKETKKPIVKKKIPLTKKKKLWFQIAAPAIFGNAIIGESVVEDVKCLIGKKLHLSLMTLTGDMKKQHISITFNVDKIANNIGQTIPVGYQVAPASIKRLVRRGRNRVDDSFVCQTKDGVRVCVKPFLLTAFETHNSTIADIRRMVVAYIATYASKYDYNIFFKDIVSGKLQGRIRDAVSHIYPIRISEIRMLQVVKDTVGITALPVPNINIEGEVRQENKSEKQA